MIRLYSHRLWILLFPALFLFSNELLSQLLIAKSIPVCNNFLNIKGESNVNEFSFTYSTPLNISDKANNHREVIEISIPVKNFRASNPMMYDDFLKLMKENRYPRITISFSKEQMKNLLYEPSQGYNNIGITIAGITRQYNINCLVNTCNENMFLSGKEVIRLSDFKLKPPEKLLGLIKVNNEINVEFGFIITFTPDNQLSDNIEN